MYFEGRIETTFLRKLLFFRNLLVSVRRQRDTSLPILIKLAAYSTNGLLLKQTVT
jgi:hypothetical protein